MAVFNLTGLKIHWRESHLFGNKVLSRVEKKFENLYDAKIFGLTSCLPELLNSDTVERRSGSRARVRVSCRASLAGNVALDG